MTIHVTGLVLLMLVATIMNSHIMMSIIGPRPNIDVSSVSFSWSPSSATLYQTVKGEASMTWFEVTLPFGWFQWEFYAQSGFSEPSWSAWNAPVGAPAWTITNVPTNVGTFYNAWFANTGCQFIGPILPLPYTYTSSAAFTTQPLMSGKLWGGGDGFFTDVSPLCQLPPYPQANMALTVTS